MLGDRWATLHTHDGQPNTSTFSARRHIIVIFQYDINTTAAINILFAGFSLDFIFHYLRLFRDIYQPTLPYTLLSLISHKLLSP